MVCKNNRNFLLPDSILKTQAVLDGIHLSIPSLEISNVLKGANAGVDIGEVSAALKSYVAISAGIPDITLSTKALLGLTNTLSILPTIKISSIAEAVIPLVDTSVLEVLKNSATLAAITSVPQVEWAWISEVCAEADCRGDREDKDFTVTPKIRTEIAADITSVLSHPYHAGMIAQSNYVKWKEQHPFLADLYIQVLLPLIQAILYGLITLGAASLIASATKDSRVYEEPASTSNVVYNVSMKQNITIIGDAPYFYEVEFPDPETGRLITGYVYKGNLVINELEEPIIERVEAESASEITESVDDTPKDLEKTSE